MKISWVFDLISPYSYLGLTQLSRLPAGTDVELVPALFGVVLNHHGQIGPAEIDSKRRFTYRFMVWRARQMAVPFKMPPTHPFNPLSAMRLVIAAGPDRRAVQTAFDFVFRDGRDVSDPVVLADLAQALGLPDLDAALNDPAVKQTLRKNTEWAIAKGVFGVPTFVVGDELFWGHDAFDMVVDYLRDPAGFEDAEMRRIDSLPVGVTRSSS
ncbi:MAG TPA: 2-hydroxychromene-2-carboxylate isomerase [Steroidobacteraceae bacterium]|nr:2-hydroxychromene-2-carboxylate isomerase [Steroidobacteraceae bacterium]